MFKKEYDLICSLGANCSVAHNLLYKGLRRFSLPFDWCYVKDNRFLEYLCEGFKNDFKDFLMKEHVKPLDNDEYNREHTDKAQYKDIYTGYYFVNHFSLNADFEEDYKTVYEKMIRRLNRLQKKIKKGKDILFLISTSLNIDINLVKKLSNTLKDLYPDKNFDFYVMQFKQKKNEVRKFDNITVCYNKRAENKNDYNKTNKEWRFLDKVTYKSDEYNNILSMTKIKNLVSVLIPAYNHEKYVQETIKSIINQTYQNIELIVVDDGSKDSTWQKIEEMRDECQKRFVDVHFETKENEGTCKTLNRLLELSKGEYIYIIASDDMAKPDAIKTEIEFLSEHDDYSLVVGDNEIIDENGQKAFWDKDRNLVYAEEEAKYLTFGDALQKWRPEIDFNSDDFGTYTSLVLLNYIPNGYLIRKSIFEKTGYFTPDAPLEDYWLMLQISKYSKMKYINKILFSYRWHNTNAIKNLEKMDNFTKITRQYERDNFEKVDKSLLSDSALEYYKHGILYRKSGIKNLFEILRYDKGNKKIKYVKLFGLTVFRLEKPFLRK